MTRTRTDDPFWGIEPRSVLGRGRGNDAHYADLFLEDAAIAFVRREGGAIVRAARDRSRGLAVRVLTTSGKTRIATSTGIDASTASSLAGELGGPEAAADRALVTFRTEASIRPESRELDHRLRLAELAERVARGVSREVKEVSVTVRDGVRKTAIAGSDGRRVAIEHVRAIAAVEVIAQTDGVTQSAFEACGGAGGLERVEEADVERTARLAAERAVRMLHARPAPAGEMAVVLAAEAGGTFVHEAVGHSLEADAVIEGMAALGERVGELVASPLVSVADDSTLLGKNGSFAADDEGVEGQRALLIDRGVLVGLLHDERTALVMGARSNGKGRRESFRCRPIVRMSNTMILPGVEDAAAIVRDTDRGLYVVRMGGGEVDPVTGQFVFEVSEAYLIEGGLVGEPVRGATLAGNAEEVLVSIDRVGSDLGFGIGTCGKDGQDVPVADAEPTIRVPRLVVGGG